MLKLRSAMTAAGLIGALAVTACGSNSVASSGGSGAKSSFIYLVEVDQTGPTKAYGDAQLAGIEAATKTINSSGGILGHQIVLNVINDNGDTQTGSSVLLSYLSSHPALNAAYLGDESTLQGALAPIAARHDIFTVTAGDGNGLFAPANDPQTKFPLGFQIQGSSEPEAEAAAQFFKTNGDKKVGILEGNFAYAQSELPYFVATLDKLGISHTVVQASLTATSLTPQVDQLKSQGVDGVFAQLIGTGPSLYLNARAQLGWPVTTVGDVGFISTDLTKTVSSAELKSVYGDYYPGVPTNTTVPGVKAMLQAVGLSKANELGETEQILSYGWDAVYVLRDAARRANSLDKQKMANALTTGGKLTDPAFATFPTVEYSITDHQNFAPTAADYAVEPVGPIKNAQLQIVN
jgi:branched-chain amino acid transport system substrate-binding protein